MTTTTLTDAQRDFSIFSDVYKDVYGVRPRGACAAEFLAMDEDGRRRELDRLGEALEAEMAEDRRRKERAVAEFRAARDRIAEESGVSAETATRWLVQADDVDAENDPQWASFFCYLNGLPYSMEDEVRRCYLEG